MNLWKRERLQSVLYKAVKHEDVEMAAKCLKMGAVDVNTRYEPVRSFILAHRRCYYSKNEDKSQTC